jgi:regulator of sigma E protease
VQIQEIAPDSLAQEVGLQSGDVILNINGRVVDGINIGSVLQRYIDNDITIVYERGDSEQSIETRCPPDNCVLGILIANESNVDIQSVQFPFPQSAAAGLHEIGAQAKLTFFTLGNLLTNLVSLDNERISSSLNNLTGPVGAIKFGDTLRQAGGWIAYLAFAAIISLALALFNVLPIPALDGGRLLGVLIQWIARLKPEKYFTIEGYINVIFFVLLLGLGIYIILKDLVRFW